MSNQPENRFPGPKPPKPIIENKDDNKKKFLATFSKAPPLFDSHQKNKG